MSSDFISYITLNFYSYNFPSNTIIYKEGDFGNFFFILLKGNLEIIKSNENEIKEIKEWNCFGESSLLNNSKRQETIKSNDNIILLVLDGLIYRECLQRIADNEYKEKFNFLNSLSYLKTLDGISKYILSEKLTIKNFRKGEIIIKQNDIGNSMYIIKLGCVSCQIKKKEFKILYENEYFGQNSILFDIPRSMDIISKKDTICYMLTRNDLKEVFGSEYYRDKILFSLFKSVISNNQFLKTIIFDSLIEEIYQCFKIKFYKENELIVNPSIVTNSSNKRIIIVLDGNIKNKENEIIAGRNNIIGYEYLENNKEVISKYYIAHPDLISFECEINDLSQFLGKFFLSKITFFKKMKKNSVFKLDNKNEKITQSKITKQINPVKLLNRISKLREIYLFQSLSKESLENLAVKMTKKKI